MFRKQLGLISAQIRNYGSLTDLNEQAIKESRQRISNMVEEAKLIGKKIGLTEKDIEWYASNHTEVVQYDDSMAANPVVTYKDIRGTYSVSSQGKIIYNRPMAPNVNEKGKRTK